MENDYLYHLKEAQDIVDECEGESDSTLCSNCPCTDYGAEKNYSSHPGFGMVTCEGSHCEEASENVEDNLIDEYNYRKGELNMKDKANMKVEIDLSMLEQNLVKMVTDGIEDEVVNTLVNKLIKKIEPVITDKANKMVEEKIKAMTKNDIYNIKIESDGNDVNLFDYMIVQMISEAKGKSIEFSNKINEITESINYKSVNEDYKENEFKVLTTYIENGYGGVDGMSIEINGKDAFELSEGEPEDMTFNRNLNELYSLPDLIKKAYLAGKSGKIMYEASEIEKDGE